MRIFIRSFLEITFIIQFISACDRSYRCVSDFLAPTEIRVSKALKKYPLKNVLELEAIIVLEVLA